MKTLYTRAFSCRMPHSPKESVMATGLVYLSIYNRKKSASFLFIYYVLLPYLHPQRTK